MNIPAVELAKIGYLAECASDYAATLTLQDTRAKLRNFAAGWRPLADDSHKIIEAMSLSDFRQFREGLRKERRGVFAGEDWMRRFADVLMPKVLFGVSIVATQYHVPWGCAYQRLVDVGRVVVGEDGIARMIEKSDQVPL